MKQIKSELDAIRAKARMIVDLAARDSLLSLIDIIEIMIKKAVVTQIVGRVEKEAKVTGMKIDRIG